MVNWGVLDGAPKWFNTPWTKLDFPFSEEEELEIARYCEKIKQNIEKDKMTPWERWNAMVQGQEVDMIHVQIHPETTYSVKALDGYADAVKPIDSFKHPKLFLKAHLASIAVTNVPNQILTTCLRQSKNNLRESGKEKNVSFIRGRNVGGQRNCDVLRCRCDKIWI